MDATVGVARILSHRFKKGVNFFIAPPSKNKGKGSFESNLSPNNSLKYSRASRVSQALRSALDTRQSGGAN